MLHLKTKKSTHARTTCLEWDQVKRTGNQENKQNGSEQY